MLFVSKVAAQQTMVQWLELHTTWLPEVGETNVTNQFSKCSGY